MAILKYAEHLFYNAREVMRVPHWTKNLFVNHPELFAKALEERVSVAGGEVDLLLKYLGEKGFKPRRILDLNCGIGRHSVELGRRGISVVGTDISPYYIRIAEKRARNKRVSDKVHFKVADMRKIGKVLAGEKFDGVINLLTSFGYYDDETDADILRQCCNLVRSGGFFALEIANRDYIVKNFQPQGFSRQENLILLEDRSFDAETSRAVTTWTYLVQKDERNFVLEKQFTLDTRLWSVHELIDLFEKTGWKFRAVCSGFGRQQGDVPLTDLLRLFFIAVKPMPSKKRVAGKS